MEDSEMGVIASKLGGGSSRDEPQFEGDDVTGLSASDKRIISRTFNVVKQETAKNGERLFLIFFGRYPQHQRHFRDFRDRPTDELAGTPKLIAHGTSVLGAFAGIVLSLNEPPVLVELLLKIGRSHGRRRIEPQALLDLKVAILELFGEVLGVALTEQVAEVWGRALDVILATVRQGMDDYAKDH